MHRRWVTSFLISGRSAGVTPMDELPSGDDRSSPWDACLGSVGLSRSQSRLRYFNMAQTTIIQLTDDLDGTPAEETIAFVFDGRSYEIDLNKKNAQALRKALAPYIEGARSVRRSPGARSGRAQAPSGSKTLFSQLDAEEKDRFRKWADMPTARRIGDSRVQEWIDAGRP